MFSGVEGRVLVADNNDDYSQFAKMRRTSVRPKS